MSEELKPDPNQVDEIHEAQLAAERMASGEEKVQSIDVDADYEASKQYSVSNIDKSGASAEAAVASTTYPQKMPESTEMKSASDPTENPVDYREMAKEINPKV